MKVVFMGTPDFSVPSLEALVNGDMAMFARFGLETVASAGAIAVGSSLVSAVTRILMAQKSARH